MAKCCPTCGQTLPFALKFSVSLSPMQRKLVERVHRAGREGICSTDLFDFMYGDDPNGGPEHGVKSLASFICQLNYKIRADGKRVRAPKGGMRMPGNYVLESL